MTTQTHEFEAEWPEPEARYLRSELPEPPALPLEAVFGPIWADWICKAAAAKGAPPDYVMAALIAVAGTLIGNTRWVSPWLGWKEPPILWFANIGMPSMNKSPGFDAVLGPLKELERAARKEFDDSFSAYREKAEIAKLAEAHWKETAKTAIREGHEPPAKPANANPGPQPVPPRYSLNDATVERIGVILASQPRGVLMFRDELAGWLQNMTRYSGGGSDRPFWLEAYGGRSFSVERMGRDPVYIEFLSVGVLGGIQPDRLSSLLLKTEDDGLLARFIPVWPNPAPISRPETGSDEGFLTTAMDRLLNLQMPIGKEGNVQPWYVPFSDEAAQACQTYREAVGAWETGAEGLLLSFIGKLPGLAVRLSLILSFLDYAAYGENQPEDIEVDAFRRAAHFMEFYALPMARRAYAEAALVKPERAARRLVGIIKERGLKWFNSREILRIEKAGLKTKIELDPALSLLEEANVIRQRKTQPGAKGGAPQRLFDVNPALWSKSN